MATNVSRCTFHVLGLAAVLLLPAPVAADPVRITSGSVETSQLMTLARGTFEGDDFFMSFSTDSFWAPVNVACWPCSAGTTLDLGGAFNGPRASGTAVVDGTTYPQIYFDGMTGTFTSPSFVVTGETTFTITQPFTYNGLVSGYLVNPFVSGFTEPVFTKTLTGQGTATATFLFGPPGDGDAGGGYFFASELRYDFDDAAPVPEPATMLLCGAGTAFLALRRRRRAQQLE